MSLTDIQIVDLSRRMKIPLASVKFKDELKAPLQFNKSYIINLENSIDENGQPNDGTHWTFLQINKYPNNKIESIYFDPYGAPPSENIKKVVEQTTGKQGLPHTDKDIQSLMNNACGYYCSALGHFINASQYRSKDLYDDVSTFLDMFEDLNTSVDFKKNEFVLKHFFRSENEKLRKEIDVIAPIDNISKQDEKGGIDMMKLPVDIKYISK